MLHQTWQDQAQAPITGPKVGFQGTLGSFSEEAARRYFGLEAECIGMDDFSDVVQALEAGQVDYGMLPIENSSTGSITEVYDLLAAHDVVVVGELLLQICQNLLALPGVRIEDLKRVYSHPQGLSQSKTFLRDHGLQPVPYNDTATAAKYLAEEGSRDEGAIASARAAEAYGLEILAPEINFNTTNQTRFFALRKVPEKVVGQNKASITFKVAHKPGSLYDALRYFANGDYDMTRIESRPVVGKPWEYAFYIDLMGNLEDSFFTGTLDRVAAATVDYRFLGAYRQAEEDTHDGI